MDRQVYEQKINDQRFLIETLRAVNTNLKAKIEQTIKLETIHTDQIDQATEHLEEQREKIEILTEDLAIMTGNYQTHAGINEDFQAKIEQQQEENEAIIRRAEAAEQDWQTAEAKIKKQQGYIKELTTVCNEVRDWLDTSSLQEVIVHSEKPETDALVMGIASHLTRLETALAKAEEMLE